MEACTGVCNHRSAIVPLQGFPRRYGAQRVGVPSRREGQACNIVDSQSAPFASHHVSRVKRTPLTCRAGPVTQMGSSAGPKSRAVVLGGGMAGLAATRTLADLFEEVVLVERDVLPDQEEPPAKRGGVAQYVMPHVMLVGGLLHCEELFANFRGTLQEAGATQVDWLKDCSVFDFGGYMERVPRNEDSPLDSVGATRKLMEHVARRTVLSHAGVKAHFGAVVTDLRFSEGKDYVSGVVLKGAEEIEADLVVDATGRNSKLPAWLQSAGFGAVPVQGINAGLGYGTRTYKVPPDWEQQHGWKASLISPRPLSGRSGMLLPVENDQWQLILTGLAGDHPPADEEGYLEFARSLPQQSIYEAISQATPVGPISTYARTENMWRRYDQIDMPGGVVVLGDAAASFNPIYGQGMTVGLKGAILLRDLLRKRLGGGKFSSGDRATVLKGFGKEFQTELAALQQFPWAVATGDDEKHLRAMGKLPPKKMSAGEAFISWYFLQAARCAMRDYKVNKALAMVTHMVEPPSALFKPEISTKVALLSLQDALAKVTGALRGSNNAQVSPAS